MSDPRGKVGWWSDPKGRPDGRGPRRRRGRRRRPDAPAPAGRRPRRPRSAASSPSASRSRTTSRARPGPSSGAGWRSTPQHAFYKTPGVAEEVAVGVAQNAADGKLSVFTNPRAHGRSFHDGKEPGPEGRDALRPQLRRAVAAGAGDRPGVRLRHQLERVDRRPVQPGQHAAPRHRAGDVRRRVRRRVQPRHRADEGRPRRQLLLPDGRQHPPLQGGPARSRRSSRGRSRSTAGSTTGATSQPEFRDTVGDPVHRDHRGWGKGLALRQPDRAATTSSAAKVSLDAANVYFYVRTRDTLTTPPGRTGCSSSSTPTATRRPAGSATTSWSTARSAGPGRTTLERNVGGRYEWGSPAEIPSRAAGNELELSIPRAALGLAALPAAIDFKWADNIQQTGDWSDFTLNGDAAPNDRFNYRAILKLTLLGVRHADPKGPASTLRPRGSPGTRGPPAGRRSWRGPRPGRPGPSAGRGGSTSR